MSYNQLKNINSKTMNRVASPIEEYIAVLSEFEIAVRDKL